MDPSAFEPFYEATSGPLHAYVSRTTGDATLADDVVQDAYLRFLRSPPERGDSRAARAYLFRVATNLIRDHARREASLARRAERARDADGASERGPPNHETRVDVRRALDRLRERDRRVLWLAYVVGMSHREIAEVIGVAEGSVKVLALRARRRFQAIFRVEGAGQRRRATEAGGSPTVSWMNPEVAEGG